MCRCFARHCCHAVKDPKLIIAGALGCCASHAYDRTAAAVPALSRQTLASAVTRLTTSLTTTALAQRDLAASRHASTVVASPCSSLGVLSFGSSSSVRSCGVCSFTRWHTVRSPWHRSMTSVFGVPRSSRDLHPFLQALHVGRASSVVSPTAPPCSSTLSFSSLSISLTSSFASSGASASVLVQASLESSSQVCS